MPFVLSKEGAKTEEAIMKRYQEWLEKSDEYSKNELLSLKDDPQEIENRFYKELSFGTGGIRGILGVGTSMMNVYVVRRAAQGLANYGKKIGKTGSAVVCYDTRKMSKEFAIESARVLSANGFKAYVFDQPRPTPFLSFAVRELNADWGIVITASHNPPQYNGFKVYLSNGVQATPKYTNDLSSEIGKLDYFEDVKLSNEGINWLNSEEIDRTYLRKLEEFFQRFDLNGIQSLKVIYTPLHGSGLIPVTKMLKLIGAEFHLVENQALPDPSFPTITRPNPEEREAFKEALKYIKENDLNFDLIIATDPDCDRMGIAYNTGDDVKLLTGNQIGVLMMDFLLNNLEVPNNSFAVKTIVTTDMVKPMCENENIELIETLTGFKFIGEKIEEKVHEGQTFIFAFEESYGYLAGNFVRDKDGVIASALMCATFNWLKRSGKNPQVRLKELMKKYGFFSEKLLNIEFEPQGFEKKLEEMMDKLRNDPPIEIKGLKLSKMIDHLQLKNELTSNVIQLLYGDKLRVIVRPSGTEPKLKLYIKVRSNSELESREILKEAQETLEKFTKQSS